MNTGHTFKSRRGRSVVSTSITTIATLLVAIAMFPGSAAAAYITLKCDGWVTMYAPDGSPVNNFSAGSNIMGGWRTAMTGTAIWNTDTMHGDDFFAPITMLGGTLAFDSITGDAIGDGTGGAGTYILNNIVMDYSGFIGTFNDFAGSAVSDGAGFAGALLAGLNIGDVVTGVGSTSATDTTLFGGVFMPLGAVPIASTRYNTTLLGSGLAGLPISLDGTPGSPMPGAPFAGYSAAVDITRMEVLDISQVPLPGALWLFMSGFGTLLATVRRRRLC